MKWVLAVSSFLFVALGLDPAQEFASRYKRVDSYEIRPGIMATPTYSSHGLVCRVDVEKRHVQPGVVEMSATIPSELTREIIDELAPPDERGPRSPGSGPFDYDEINGSVAILPLRYKNVSIEIYRNRREHGDTAVILTWRKAGCPKL